VVEPSGPRRSPLKRAPAAAGAAAGARDKLALPSLRMTDEFVPAGSRSRGSSAPTLHQVQRGSRSTLVSAASDDAMVSTA
jgi:hypothetical protein